MNQRWLSTSSLVMIKHTDLNQQYCMSNSSFLRSQVSLVLNSEAVNFENYLFFVEKEGQSRTDVEFQQPILFRHKITNRYLSCSQEFEEEENDTTYKLYLSEKKHYFKILACFQYQIKISNKVKFNEDIYLTTAINSTKIGYISTRPTENAHEKRTLVGLNYKSKLLLHSYCEMQKQETGYMFGQAVWLQHIQSKSFLSCGRKVGVQKQKESVNRVVFQMKNMEDDLQDFNGLWVIDSIKSETGGKLKFGQRFRLKNLYTGCYLAFQPEPLKSTGKVYLESSPSNLSLFEFHSLKGEETEVKKQSYLIFKHSQSHVFIGTRKKHHKQETESLQLMTFGQFEDEDLFAIKELNIEAQEAVRFIFSIKKELEYISKLLLSGNLRQRATTEIAQLYSNMFKELSKLSKIKQLFEDVQDQLGSYISNFCSQIQQLRLISSPKAKELMSQVYEILRIICQGYSNNQKLLSKYLEIFIQDVFSQVLAQQLLSQIFRNNYSVLCKMPTAIEKGNIVNLIFKKILLIGSLKNKEYWKKFHKILDFLSVLLRFEDNYIDINQRLISTQLFEKGVFDQIIFPLKIMNQRIRIFNPDSNKFVEIQQIKTPDLTSIIQKVFKLLSDLCANRNFIAKFQINSYLNPPQKNGVQVLISYLNTPISRNLSNNLFSLITNLYIDSCPRILRHKPLAVVNFVFQKDFDDDLKKSSSQQQAQITSRLKDNLLNKAEEAYASKPLKISNILMWALSLQPTVNNHELAYYKEQLNLKISTNVWSSDLLKSISILIKLESYSIEEMIDISHLLQQKIKDTQLTSDIISETMDIFKQILFCCQEMELKKMTVFLKEKFKRKSTDLTAEQIPYLLPESKKIMFTARKQDGSSDPAQYKQSIISYNKMCDTLAKLYPSQQIKQIILNIYSKYLAKPSKLLDLRAIFNAIMKFSCPKQNFLKLLMESIIVTSSQAQVFQILFQIYKKLRHLVSISEHWLYTQEGKPQDTITFITSLRQITNFLYEDYQISSGEEINTKTRKVNVNRQLLIRNISMHSLIIQLLQSSFFLLQGKMRSELIKKHRDVFDLCFEFISTFVLDCPENKTVILTYMNILIKFRDMPQVGQTKLFISLFQDNKDFIKQIKQNFIQKIILHIIKSQKTQSQEGCEFKPAHLQLLLTLLTIKGKIYKPNLQLVYRCIEKDLVFRKLLFLQDKKGSKVFCLNPQRLRNQPTQVPFIYHNKILKIINMILEGLESQSALFKGRIKELININYLLELLALDDIYSHTGILPELNFLVKKQVMRLLMHYLQKSDALTKLYDNENLYNLVSFYQRIFVYSPPKQTSLASYPQYLPHIYEYEFELAYWKQNQREYYLNDVKPFLLRIYGVFSKLATRDINRIYNVVNRVLESVKIQNLGLNHFIKKKGFDMDQVRLKWRNFVDKDQNNSNEEKFAKRVVLEILKHKATANALKQEKKAFHKLIARNQSAFIKVSIKLLQLSIQQQRANESSPQNIESIFQITNFFSQNLEHLQDNVEIRREVCTLLSSQKLIDTLIDYASCPQFQFNNIKSRRIFYEILVIFNFMIENDEDFIILKLFYKAFNENISAWRFWLCLKDSIMTVGERIEANHVSDHINIALSEMKLVVQQKQFQLDKQALKFITILCDYTPFTQFLRYQPPYQSIDFLDKIYNSLYHMLHQGGSLIISVTTVDIAQVMLDAILAMFNGVNKNNQNYVIQNKYTDVVNESLKMERVHQNNRNTKAELARRDRLLEEVIGFYQSNGIDVRNILEARIKLLDFNHLYLINRMKFNLLKVLIECSVANQTVVSRIRIMIPLQFLKINLIWVYEDYIEGKHKYTEQNLLKKREKFEDVIAKKEIDSLYLMIGFYFYILIQLHGQEKIDDGDEDTDVGNDEQKNNQKIIKKFFKSISDKNEDKSQLKQLQKQPYAQEMKLFYSKYYKSLHYFEHKTVTIQANISGNFTKLYFPKIPLCNKITEQTEQRFKGIAERISQDQKIKSLLQFEEELYYQLQGEEDFYRKIDKMTPILKVIIKLAQDQQKIFLINWIVAVLITLFYLLEDYMNPSYQFANYMLFYLKPTSFFTAWILILTILNAVIAMLLLINLIVARIPLMLSIFRKKYDQSDEKKEGGWRNSFILYAAGLLLPDMAYNLYVIIFSFCTIAHPFFTGFLLIYIIFRIELGQQILRSIRQTWLNLLVASGMIVVFAYVETMIVYNFFTYVLGYGPICQDGYFCWLMVFDQSLKSGSGFLGSQTQYNYQYMAIGALVFCEIVYILFASKVISEIFSGTIIDKFSELRQQSQTQQQDQESKCYICGQQRFSLDFELQGFQKHIQQTHNKMHYIYYLFYIRRQRKEDHGVAQRYVHQSMEKKKKDWIPQGTSLLKIQKDRDQQVQVQEDEETSYQKYYQLKIQDLKKIKQGIQIINTNLKGQNYQKVKQN